MVNKYLFLSFVFGVLFSTAIYAFGEDDNALYVTGDDIKIVLYKVSDVSD